MSVIIDLMSWLRTRILIPRIVLLIFLLWGGSQWMPGKLSSDQAVKDLSFLAGFVILFRFWDDLQDAELDRVRGSEHGLSGIRQQFGLKLVLLAGVGVMMPLIGRYTGWLSSGLFVALCGLVASWYHLRHHCPNRFLSYHLLLLKYPAFVIIVGLGQTVLHLRMIEISVCVYFAVCLWELRSEPDLWSKTTGRWIGCVESVLLVGVLLSLLIAGPGNTP